MQAAFRAFSTRISNRSARQKRPVHMADYPIWGLRGVLKSRRSTAVQHRSLVIGVRVWSRCRRPIDKDGRICALVSLSRVAF